MKENRKKIEKLTSRQATGQYNLIFLYKKIFFFFKKGSHFPIFTKKNLYGSRKNNNSGFTRWIDKIDVRAVMPRLLLLLLLFLFLLFVFLFHLLMIFDLISDTKEKEARFAPLSFTVNEYFFL